MFYLCKNYNINFKYLTTNFTITSQLQYHVYKIMLIPKDFTNQTTRMLIGQHKIIFIDI